MSDLHSWSSQVPVYPPLGLEQQAQKPAAGPLLALLLSGSFHIPPGPAAGVGDRGGSGVAFPPCCDCKPYQEWCKVLLSWWQSKEKLLGVRTA